VHLYFSPLACSLATRIVGYEAAASLQFIQVDTKSKTLTTGGDFWQINPLGQVPVLKLGDGTVLTENTAILEHVAELHPQAALVPAASVDKARMRQWLGFTATELHKAVFVPLLDSTAGEDVKSYARHKIQLRMDRLQSHLAQRNFLLDQFTVADAYLTTVLNWAARPKSSSRCGRRSLRISSECCNVRALRKQWRKSGLCTAPSRPSGPDLALPFRGAQGLRALAAACCYGATAVSAALQSFTDIPCPDSPPAPLGALRTFAGRADPNSLRECLTRVIV
jgi:glutathione S-transferase